MTTPSGDAAKPTTPASNPVDAKTPPRGKWSGRMRKIGIVGGILLVCGAVSLGGSEYYTSRPDFCGTCHIMDPYYKSWSKDKHGAKIDVWCVECHYAPGHQHTINAKFRGLSQLASYFSGRYGASRPRAHVDDASCMRSKCHGDGEHLQKQLRIGTEGVEKRIIFGQETEIKRSPTVRFIHAKHLKVPDRVEQTEAAIAALTAKLKTRAGDEGYAKIEAASRVVTPSAVRESNMKDLVKQLGIPDAATDALELMRLEHVKLRLDQLDGIHCAACHSYDADGGRHFRVDKQTCFVCHFTNQAFNRDTGECLKCHEPPTRQIAVHSLPPARAGAVQGALAASGPTSGLMDHLDIVNRGINCQSCHLDVISGDTQVAVRECTHCHDQGHFTKDFDKRDTRMVMEYHKAHIAQQTARCPDCHRGIEHKLVDPMHVGTSDQFLQPVLNDCQHCHPGHHQEQVKLLMGVGGEVAAGEPAMPNAMFGSRLNCRACHSQAGSDFKGDALIKATEDTCTACHGNDYRRLFEQWMGEITNNLKEAEAALVRVDERLKAVKDQGVTLNAERQAKLDQARANIDFVKKGNGVHNKTYALHLLDTSIRDLDDILREIGPK